MIKKTDFNVITVVIALCALATVCVGYKKISNQLASVKTEVASVKTEVTARKDFIPPIFGASHVALRKHFVLNQITQVESDFILIVGDSIVEGMNLPSLLDYPVISAGIGGGGISDALDFISQIPADTPVKGIIIAIGVNDTVQGQTTDEHLNKWGQTLKKAIQKARQLAGANVAVSTIIPVEKGKALGDQYFDPEKITGINRIIRDITKETHTQLIDQSIPFDNLTKSGIEYTSDGVHLNGPSYQLMKSNIRKVTHGSFAYKSKKDLQ